jgi:uncharacterized protein GlcG (DUF336 family)
MSDAPTAPTGPIGLAAAQTAIAAGVATAESLGISVSVAIVDAGGVLKAFGRMDGAEIAGETLAVDKAYTAVATRTSTAELAALAVPGGELYGLQSNGNGRYIMFAGGLPVLLNNEAIGGIGVSGGNAAQDTQIAEAVVDALAARL